ncbi:hypothetical protein GpartN1_g3301.t1 [Galdieria partita]|uniref:Uncharacterized protein n=1 Tax=Galdieria partita TaxID=83374 RepID=A0A9C7PVS9_9RHOD|nr:hypothetical protein GpartN1_g3301.t1 [Galdieria partita]
MEDSLWSCMLTDLWNSPLSVTFRNDYLDGELRDKNVTKPRCPMGSLVEIAQRPDEEDNTCLVPLDEKLLRRAFPPSDMEVQEPEWLQQEQPLRIPSYLKKTHKRKSKRKRDKEETRQTTGEIEEQKKRKWEPSVTCEKSNNDMEYSTSL